MIPLVKKCKNLTIDKRGEASCKSTHICYRSVCFSDMYLTVLHLGAYIHCIRGKYQRGEY